MKRKTGAILVLIMIVATTLCTACGQSGEASRLGIDAREASLTEIWDRVLEVAGCDNSTANLNRLMLETGTDGSIVLMSIIFQAKDSQGNCRVYFVDSGIKGDVTYYSLNGMCDLETAHPLSVFSELDQAIPRHIAAEGISASIYVDFVHIGATVYVDYTDEPSNYPYTHMQHLKDGDLRLLNRVVYSTSKPWATIHVWKNPPGQYMVRGTCELWLLTSDLAKAELVEYARVR